MRTGELYTAKKIIVIKLKIQPAILSYDIRPPGEKKGNVTKFLKIVSMLNNVVPGNLSNKNWITFIKTRYVRDGSW
jgi:hypothetical protein